MEVEVIQNLQEVEVLEATDHLLVPNLQVGVDQQKVLYFLKQELFIQSQWEQEVHHLQVVQTLQMVLTVMIHLFQAQVLQL